MNSNQPGSITGRPRRSQIDLELVLEIDFYSSAPPGRCYAQGIEIEDESEIDFEK